MSTPQLSNADVRDIETLIHPYTNLAAHREIGPTVIDRGEGIHVYDSNGKRYIEGLAGLWCTALGYANKELIETAHEQLSTLSYTHIFGGKSHESAIALAEKLKEIVPVAASKILYTSSGSEANDTQIKLQWYYNNARGRSQKKKIISRNRGYHGVTIASASLTGLDPVHTDFDLPMARVLHTRCPHFYREGAEGESEEAFATRCADELDELIRRENPDSVAAFIAEPVMGAGGVIVPPKGYFPKIKAVLDKYDVAFIGDEVICGFGRTGEMFGAETFGMQPDTISMAKALTSAYIPLGAITVSEPLYEAMLDQSRKIGTFGHGYTYSGHPVGCAVAVKAIEIYQRENIVAHVQSVGTVFKTRLDALRDHPLVGEARGVGLIGALELVSDKDKKTQFDPKKGVAARAVQFIQEEGVILRPLMGDAIAFCPPLIISGAEVNEMFDATERGLNRALDWAKSEQLI